MTYFLCFLILAFACLVADGWSVKPEDTAASLSQKSVIDGSCSVESDVDAKQCALGFVQLRAERQVHTISSKEKVLFFRDVEVTCTGKLISLSDKRPVAEAVYEGCDYPSECTKRAAGTCDAPDHNFVKQCDELGVEIPLKGEAKQMIVLTQEYVGAYYHFVSEALNRLVYVQQEHPTLLQDKEVLIHTSFIDETAQSWVRLLGIDTTVHDSRLVLGRWHVTEAVWPPSNPCFDPLKKGTVGLRSMIETTTAPWNQHKKDDKPTALLLRRMKKRAITNHDEVVATLEGAGWTVKVLSDDALPDVATQCAMFHNADFIVGPHGAGFSNLVCARAKTPVLEFTQTPAPEIDCFKNIAATLDHPFITIQAELSHSGSGPVNSMNVMNDALKAMSNFKPDEDSWFDKLKGWLWLQQQNITLHTPNTGSN